MRCYRRAEMPPHLRVRCGFNQNMKVCHERPPADLRQGCRTDRAFQQEGRRAGRSEEHTSELQSLMRNSFAAFCLKKKNNFKTKSNNQISNTNRDYKQRLQTQ